MADITPILEPAPPVTAPVPKRERGNVNSAQVRSLDLAETIAQAAQREPYATQLAAREISARHVAVFQLQITTCRDAIAQGLQNTADRASATRQESMLQKALISQLRQVQAAANQKYARDPQNRPQLRAYWIGSGLQVNRATLHEAAHDILDKLQSDTLPGVTAEFQQALRETLTTWKAANQKQATALTTAVQAREDAVRLGKQITDERLKIQFAIDATYPIGADGSAAVRAAFGIPKTRPLRVR